MPNQVGTSQVVRFAMFEVDLQTQELRKAGVRLRLPGQSFQVLKMLLERPGALVTREEFQRALWRSDTFVDFEHGLSAAVNRLREVLGDSADHPQFIETLPRRGYRLIVPVAQEATSISSCSDTLPAVKSLSSQGIFQHRLWFLGAFGIVIAFACWEMLFRKPELQRIPRVLRFTKLTNDRQTKWYSDSLFSDGSRIYFTEILPDQRTLILQVPVKGGEAVPLPIALERPKMMDLSRDGSELLLAAEHDSLWVQPVTGGSARRVGTIAAMDAGLLPMEQASFIPISTNTTSTL
jgi:DNA-binding winged helix-turn-helix (wHTH) protein